MLVKQSNILMNESMTLLDNMSYLSEAESAYPAIMVPVRRNDRLEADLIRLESFVDFASSNSIDDAGQAIAAVCEASHIGSSDIGFYVNEVSLYADDNMVDTAAMFLENGYRVAVAPISSGSLAYQSLQEALSLDENCSSYEDSYNLRAYCEDGVLDTVSNKVGGAADWVKNKASSNYNAAKETMGSGVKNLSEKYASLKKSLGEIGNKMRTAAGEAKAFLSRQYSKVKSAAGVVKSKLIAAKNGVVNGAKKIGNKVSSGAGYVKNKVVGGASYVKNKASGLFNK